MWWRRDAVYYIIIRPIISQHFDDVNALQSPIFIRSSWFFWVNIQFRGHLVSFGYSERIYALCRSEFF